MAKRAKIALSGTPIVRIVPPGFDVDSAADSQFILHESHLYSQPFVYQFVACPFAGYDGPEARNQTAGFSFMDTGSAPDAIVYPVSAGGTITFPSFYSIGPSLGTGAGYAINATTVNFFVYQTYIELNFVKAINTNQSPLGAWVILFRKAS